MLETRYAVHPDHVRTMTTEELRRHFLVEDLFVPGEVRGVYSHHDRIVAMGIVPTAAPLDLPADDQLRAEYFLQRREAGVINIGGTGRVRADGVDHVVERTACLYLGSGTREVSFSSADPDDPAVFYLVSGASNEGHPTTLVRPGEANAVDIGKEGGANRRTLNQCILAGRVTSSRLAMGYTQIHHGSVWNTMPAHTHDRRTEFYLYFDLADDARVLHVMGEPTQTRHLVVANRQVVISPSWSVHSGVGTGSYTFVWSTTGENSAYDDMDPVPVTAMR